MLSATQLTERQYAYVTISGPGKHEVLTAHLGLEPTDAWDIGDINPNNGKPRTHMNWILRSGLDDTHALEQHLSILLLMLGTRANLLPTLWLEYDLTLQCVGYYPVSCGPGIHFDREVIRQAAQLGLAIDYDLYFLDDHGHS